MKLLTPFVALSLFFGIEERDLNPRRGKPQLATTSLPDAVVDRDYVHILAAKGGLPPYLWGPRSPLPWLSLSDTGRLSGKTSQCGTFRFPIEIIDGAAQRSIAEISLRVGGCK